MLLAPTASAGAVDEARELVCYNGGDISILRDCSFDPDPLLCLLGIGPCAPAGPKPISIGDDTVPDAADDTVAAGAGIAVGAVATIDGAAAEAIDGAKDVDLPIPSDTCIRLDPPVGPLACLNLRP